MRRKHSSVSTLSKAREASGGWLLRKECRTHCGNSRLVDYFSPERYPVLVERVPISDAKTHLLRLVREAMIGKAFAITKGGQIVARLVPATDHGEAPRLGFAKGEILGDIVKPLPIEWHPEKLRETLTEKLVQSRRPQRKTKRK